MPTGCCSPAAGVFLRFVIMWGILFCYCGTLVRKELTRRGLFLVDFLIVVLLLGFATELLVIIDVDVIIVDNFLLRGSVFFDSIAIVA